MKRVLRGGSKAEYPWCQAACAERASATAATPRTQAFFSVVTNRARIAGGVLALTPDGRGGSFAEARLALSRPLPSPAWLVLSTEVDEDSEAAIGWPLQVGAEPAQTFDVPEVLLLDGVPAAFAREQARLSRVRWLTAAFIASAFLLSVAMLVLRVRAADRDIARHLRLDLDEQVAARARLKNRPFVAVKPAAPKCSIVGMSHRSVDSGRVASTLAR